MHWVGPWEQVLRVRYRRFWGKVRAREHIAFVIFDNGVGNFCWEYLSLPKEFDGEILNALVERIGIFLPAYFVFELKSGMNVEVVDE